MTEKEKADKKKKRKRLLKIIGGVLFTAGAGYLAYRYRGNIKTVAGKVLGKEQTPAVETQPVQIAEVKVETKPEPVVEKKQWNGGEYRRRRSNYYSNNHQGK